MATQTMTLLSERWLDQVVLRGTVLNLDGDQSDDFVGPAGLGEYAVLEVLVDVGAIATLMATPEVFGPRVSVVSLASSAAVDFVAAARWTRIEADALTAWLSPDPLVQVKEGEALRVRFEEVDTNAVPTADLTLLVKGVRVRPGTSASGETARPIRLVR